MGNLDDHPDIRKGVQEDMFDWTDKELLEFVDEDCDDLTDWEKDRLDEWMKLNDQGVSLSAKQRSILMEVGLKKGNL